MSYRTIKRLRGLSSKEQLDNVKDKILNGIKTLLYEMDTDEFMKNSKDRLSQAQQRNGIFTSILLSLALPNDLEPDLDTHFDEAASEIELDIQEYFRLRGRPNQINAAKGTAVSADAPQDPPRYSGAFTPDEEGSQDKKIPSDTGTPDLTPPSRAVLPPYVSPYLRFMVDEALAMGPGVTELRKKEVAYHIESHWPMGLGSPSQHKLEMMAMFVRHPEAHLVKV